MSVEEIRARASQVSATSDRLYTRAQQSPVRSRWVQIPVSSTAEWPQNRIAAWTDPVAVERRNVARTFARLVSNMRGVTSVWLKAALPELEVVVTLREANLDRELELRGIFIELVCAALDPSVGELSIYAEDEAPDWVQRGERLT